MTVPTDSPWIFGLGCVFAALFSYGLGANDVANSFGTSIGSGALTMRRAVVIAAGCEVLGAVTLGHGVADTLTKKISYLERDDCWSCQAEGLTAMLGDNSSSEIWQGGNQTKHTALYEQEQQQESKMGIYELGMVCALASGALFLLAATFFGLPVSTTHTIVGAVLGMTVVGTKRFSCVKWLWPGLMKIVSSWFISPIFAGALSVLLQMLIKRTILEASRGNPLKRALIALPILAGTTIAIIVLLVLLQQGDLLKTWQSAAIAAGSGLVIWAVIHFFGVPFVRKNLGQDTASDSSLEMTVGANSKASAVEKPSTLPQESAEVDLDAKSTSASDADGELASIPLDEPSQGAEEEEGEALLGGDGANSATGGEGGVANKNRDLSNAKKVFKYLQVLTATLKSFAHGANDVANAAGPFAAVQALYFGSTDPCTIQTSVWVLTLCGVGIVLGLSISGHRVIETIGRGLTSIDFPTGFSIELGSTLSVVLASCSGMPVSSTHCQVGSVISIGVYENGVGNVEWGMLNKIILSWVVTVPVSALTAAALLELMLLFF